MKVAILGSGPAGLLAALACEHRGIKPVIYSLGEKSEMFGAMYLHEPIPALTGDILAPDFKIDVIKSGTRYGYAENVYGDPSAPCSWDSIPDGETPAWDLHVAYDKLWERYEPMVFKAQVTPHNVAQIIAGFNLVLSSIPAKNICWSKDHHFWGQPIWVTHGPGRALIKDVNDNEIMYYNGTTHRDGGFDWYRFSQIKGYQAWEYSHEVEVKPWESAIGRKLSTGIKPTTTNCNCWVGSSFKRIGRFGKWQKGVLTHHAYRETMLALDERDRYALL